MDVEKFMELIPIVIKKSNQGERSYDIYSFLLRNRIIFLSGPINDAVSTSICAQLLFLEAEDPTQDIHIYINSPGGIVSSALAIYDTMQFIKPDVNTWGMGMAASCGSFLLACGTEGKRHALPNTRVMLHEPWGGYQGRSQHIEDHAKDIMYTRNKLVDIYHKHTKQDKDKINKWLDRESFFSAEEALSIGILDNVVTNRSEIEDPLTIVNGLVNSDYDLR